jgi:hypothetical protein
MTCYALLTTFSANGRLDDIDDHHFHVIADLPLRRSCVICRHVLSLSALCMNLLCM